MFQVRFEWGWMLVLLVVLAGLAPRCATAARAESVEVYAAGSLRGALSELTREASAKLGIDVAASFGGSGALRVRIEKGASPDLFLSADLASPRKLAAQGRAVLPAIAFARNRMCIISRRALGLTSANLIDRLMEKGVRIKTSTPVEDPSGDYAWAVFDHMERLRAGSAAILKSKARASMSLKPARTTPAQSATAALFAAHQVDASITYCGSGARLERELPDLVSLVVPAALDPHPVYGMAVLSDKPAALRLALYLLSDEGQAIIGKEGLLPLRDVAAGSP